MNKLENGSRHDHAQQEWEMQRIEIYEILDKLFDEVERVYPRQGLAQRYAIKEECKKFLEKSDKELSQYAAYHALIGSTTDQETSPKFDLSGENTIVNFLRAKLEELKKINI
jgi:hypothetical protein